VTGPRVRPGLREVAIDPCVPALTTDPVEGTEFFEGQAVAQLIGDELCFLVHGRCLTQGMGHLLGCPGLSSNCHPCLPTFLLPISPAVHIEAQQGAQADSPASGEPAAYLGR